MGELGDMVRRFFGLPVGNRRRRRATDRRPAPASAGARHVHAEPAATASASKSRVVQTVDLDRDWEAEFVGSVLTAPGNGFDWVITDEHRKRVAIFSNGLVLVSMDHSNSGFVTGAIDIAEKHFRARGEPPPKAPVPVTPETIAAAYRYADRRDRSKARVDSAKYKGLIEDYLKEAAIRSASDVHIECIRTGTHIQLGIGNDLETHKRLLEEEGKAIQGVIFHNGDNQSGVTSSDLEPRHANLDPRPGDPDAIFLPEGVDGIRCEYLPLVGGIYLVLRLNYSGSRMVGNSNMELEDLGLAKEQVVLWRQSYRTPGGIRIVSGPTNAGKSTTLRLVLNKLLAELKYRKNCLLVEDPPEGGVRGGRQVYVPAGVDEEHQEKIYKKIFRSILRVAPEILFLGEIRDYVSGSFCLRLGLLGKKIFTTTHVDRALRIPKKLIDLGLDPSMVFDPDTLRLLASQRLVKCLCPACRVSMIEAATGDPDVMEQAKRLVYALHKMDEYRASRGALGGSFDEPVPFPDLKNVFVPRDGGKCSAEGGCNSGRQDRRTVVAEVIVPDYELMRLLQAGDLKGAEDYWLSGNGLGGLPMRWHALDKIRAGLVSVVDVEDELGPVADEVEVERFFANSKSEEFVEQFQRLFEGLREAAE